MITMLWIVLALSVWGSGVVRAEAPMIEEEVEEEEVYEQETGLYSSPSARLEVLKEVIFLANMKPEAVFMQNEKEQWVTARKEEYTGEDPGTLSIYKFQTNETLAIITTHQGNMYHSDEIHLFDEMGRLTAYLYSEEMNGLCIYSLETLRMEYIFKGKSEVKTNTNIETKSIGNAMGMMPECKTLEDPYRPSELNEKPKWKNTSELPAYPK